MSCCDNRYAPLKASGELTEAHLQALRDYSKTTKPVFRATCPPGYTHCTRAFPTDNAGSVANNNLWFIDGHGHLCMPKCGWGSQPELRMKDKAAQMVRSKEIDLDKLQPEKIQAAAAQMQCDPCGRGTKNVSRVANMLSCTMRDLKRVDDEMLAKEKVDSPLAGGMHHSSGSMGGMGGCWSRSMSGDGGQMSHMMAAGEAASLAGGAKSSATKCELQRMVTGVDAGKLRRAADAAITPVLDKKKKYHTEKLLCKLLALHDHSPFMKDETVPGVDDSGPVSIPIRTVQTEDDIRQLAITSIKTALYCAVDAPLDSEAAAKAKHCVPSSCYSKTFKIDDTELKMMVKLFKIGKQAFDSLLRLFVEYKRVVKLCEPEKAEAERILICKIDQVVEKAKSDATKCGIPLTDVVNEILNEVSVLKVQMKSVAALKCDEPNIDDKCEAAGGKRVCSGTAMVCIPEVLADAKENLKQVKKAIQSQSLIYEYQKVVIADLRRTLNA